jgi:aerobic carbon-monoxide dehydrogenase medium subunit
MIPAAFDYVCATSLDQAIDLLNNDPEGSKLLAGGHTLIPTLKLRLASPSLLIDIRGIARLKGIEIGDDSSIRIGALTTHAELLASEPLHKALPIFREAADVIADPQVRNRGTIGGSLANADPAADWPAVMVALQAELELAGPKGLRRIAAKEFFVDIFSTALAPDEVLTHINIPRPPPGTRMTYRKVRHPASGYAIVGVAASVCLRNNVVDRVSIGITGAANRAFEGRVASDFLMGKAFSSEHISEAARLLSEATDCLSDRYASIEYRANLINVQVRRALLALS